MKNEEAIEILDATGEGRSEKDWFAAIDRGIAALENQAKYEKALELACNKICEHEECFDVENSDDDCETSDCVNCWVDYYKGKAGIEDDDDD